MTSSWDSWVTEKYEHLWRRVFKKEADNMETDKDYKTESTGIQLLYEEIVRTREELDNVRQQVGYVQESLNNGVIRRAEENRKCIKNLSEDVRKLDETIVRKQSFKLGQIATWKLVVALASAVGASVVGTLTALSLIGII